MLSLIRFSRFLDVIIRTGKETPIVVNCQLGRGRSTITSVRDNTAYHPIIFESLIDYTLHDSTMASWRDLTPAFTLDTEHKHVTSPPTNPPAGRQTGPHAYLPFLQSHQ